MNKYMEEICDNDAYQNIELKEHGCFFSEYANQMRPIFYMKLSLVSDLFDFQNIEKHKIFDQMQKEEDHENMYILKIEDMGLPFIPVSKDVVQQMIYNGELLETIDIEKFVEKYNKTFPYITKENMAKLLPLLNHELKKVEMDLQQYKIKQQIKNNNLDLDDVSDVSDNSDVNLDSD
jgi:hypothetical protein